MSRFNLTNLLFAISLTAACSGFASAQPTRGDQAVVREHVNKGNMYMTRGMWAQAIDEYNEALDADAGSMVAKENLVLVHNNWGISLFRQHKFDEAKTQWDEALKMNPYDRNAKQNLQVLKMTLERMQNAPKPPGKAKDNEEDAAGEETTSGPKITNKKGNKPAAATAPTSSESPNLDDAMSTSGPKVLGSGSASAAPAASETKSGPSLYVPSKKTEDALPSSTSAASTSAASASATSSAPTASSAPAAASDTPRPTATSTPPPIDLNSPYSFYQPSTPKPLGEVSSPYVMPTNLQPAANRPNIYTPPPSVPKQTPGAWKSPLSQSQYSDNSAQGQPAATPSEAAATSQAESDPSANLEDQLGAVELKLNGKKQKNMPIMKRIEKLENSISGKTGSGTLQERIDVLKKSCGL